MSAPYLLGLFDTIYVLALTALVGSILFFLFVLAPHCRQVMGTESGGRFLKTLLPRYYAWGASAGAIALPAFVAVPLCYPEYRGPWIGVQAIILLGCVLGMLYGGNSLQPAIDRASDAGTNGHEHQTRLRRRSLILNSLVMLAGSGQLIAFTVRPAPRTSGIRELDSTNRGLFEADLDRVIEEIEVKYGYRRPATDRSPRPPSTTSTVSPEMIQEIDTYYAKKRERDLARRPAGSTSEGTADAPPRVQPTRKTGEP